jgi:hypothetical protein
VKYLALLNQLKTLREHAPKKRQVIRLEGGIDPKDLKQPEKPPGADLKGQHRDLVGRKRA